MAVKELKDWIMGADVEEEDAELSDSMYRDDSFAPESTSIFENTTAEPKMTGTSTKVENSNKSSQMVVFEPRSYSESQGIADHLKSGRGCIINLHRVSKDQAKRIIDFLSGVVYAIEGEVQKIGPNVFLCTPSNIGVYGEITDETEE